MGETKLTKAQGHLTDSLRACRASRDLSLTAAARLAGITKAHLHDMEAGRSLNPCVSTLAGLSKAYNLPLGWMAEQFAEALRKTS